MRYKIVLAKQPKYDIHFFLCLPAGTPIAECFANDGDKLRINCTHADIDFDYSVSKTGENLCRCELCHSIGVWEWETEVFDNYPEYIKEREVQEIKFWKQKSRVRFVDELDLC